MTEDEKAFAAQFNAERRVALSTMDPKTINAFYEKYYRRSLYDNMRARNPEFSQAQVILCFWGAVHKAITADTAFPLDLRRASKRWLDAHNLQSRDDGDL